MEATLRALDLSLPPDAVARVKSTFARNAEIARKAASLDLPDGVEPAAVFRP